VGWADGRKLLFQIMSKIIIANWKMFLGIEESVSLARKIFQIKSSCKIVICPSFLALLEVKKVLGKTAKLGGQNLAWQAGGALTGEVSASMLAEVGCRYVIIGHSERRIFANEGDLVIREKIKLAVKNNLCPILCVGETTREREDNKTFTVIKKQLAVLNKLDLKKMIVAYEPVWAIGSGKTPTLQEISVAHNRIKKIVAKKIKSLSVIYGGSIDENNLTEILSTNFVDGVLIGRAGTKINFWKKLK
jgi:triosephosphate isomerase